MVWPAIIGAGASLVSGIFGNKSRSDANEANADLQREFAQNGVRWKVADAKAAGIHPLAVLGGNMPTASPSYIADDWGYVSDMGQNISRAVAAGNTQEERSTTQARETAPRYPTPEDSAARLQLEHLALERAQLQNDHLRVQIASEISRRGPDQLGPPFPSASPPPSSLVSVKPPEQEPTRSMTPGSNESVNPATRWIRTETGVVPYPGKQFIDDVELENPYGAEYWFRNRLAPVFGFQPHGEPPRSMLPSWASEWKYNTLRGEWQPDNKRDRERLWGSDRWFNRLGVKVYREPPT